ncbi:MAG: septum formation initiator family protein [Bacteroidales bacterium]|nr:septum formation initiator family protein [Muribaculaceae bacterium]MDO4971753.1 septum formation initiator family protein [Bacteroidales bacterium]
MEIFGKDIKRPSWIPRWMSFTLVVVVAVIAGLFFIGPNNFMRVVELKKEIKELKTEIKANRDSTNIYEAKTRELNTDKVSLERIAREKYGMKRLNEDVYITEIP